MSDPNQQIEHASEAATYAAAGTATLLWGLSASEIAVLSSALVAALSFVVHFIYSYRRDRREQQAHDHIMEQYNVTTQSSDRNPPGSA